MQLSRKIVYLLVLLCFTTAFAQDTTATCGPFVQQAMSAVEQDCARTGRNQACYGYVSMNATPRAGITDFKFAQEGDLARVGDLETLRLSALDPAANTWGIALMKIQANLPDALPGQNVTFLLFGDVELRNGVGTSASGPAVQITAKNGINVRSLPSTSGEVIGSLGGGEAAVANGRNADGSWLRIDIPDSGSQGWVYASLLTPSGDTSGLPVVDTLEASPFKPMQAFYFQTGIAQTNCAEAPADGILIQTPQGAGKINLRANDVDIELGSTAYFQARPSSQMVVSVVEGEGRVSANGKTVVVPAGAQVFVPVNSDLMASGAPSDPQPYSRDLVAPLPVEVLPRAITVAPPASDAAIREANQNVATPTPAPTQSASVPGGFDPSMFSGLSGAMFCTAMNAAMAQEGLTKDDFIAQMQEMRDYIPADSRAQIDQMLTMLSAC